MKSVRTVGVAVIGLLGALTAVACGGDDQVAVTPTCDDGTRNGGETGVDCGGTCGPCDFGQGCAAASDCATGFCDAGACACEAGSAWVAERGLCEGVDDCAGDPCLNGGTCVDEDGGYRCECAAGYAGDDCATDVDDCASAPCANGGTCADGVASFTCTCAAGWQGPTCEADVDECAVDNGGCDANAGCTNVDGGRTCACAVGFMGDGESCAPCDAGSWGDGCMEACAPGHCLGPVTCDPIDGGARACTACEAGFTGDDCEDACVAGSCLEGAVTCAQDGGERVCTLGCASGRWGQGCEASCPAAGCGADAEVVCDRDTGATTSCDGCVAGMSGAACGVACAQGSCLGTVTCAQDDASDALACPGGCQTGAWGATCESACAPPVGCDGTVTCDQTTGVASACGACDAGRWGATCQEVCEIDGCAGVATCDQATGAAIACSACEAGRSGATCQDACVIDGCVGAATCDQTSGAATGCTACAAGRWGATCDETCALDACEGALSCAQADGTPIACDGCDAGLTGALCDAACDAPGCVGEVRCAQDGGAVEACEGCAAGFWGATCEETCGDARCTGDVTCDRATGAVVACEGCEAGWYGAACDQACAQGACLGTVSCAQDDGATLACPGGCAAGVYGDTCDETCAQGACAGTPVCAQDGGAAVACPDGCAAGSYGDTCEQTCAQGDCAGTAVCAQDGGAAVACPDGCVDGRYGATCDQTCAQGDCVGTVVCAQIGGAATSCEACADGAWGAACENDCAQGDCVGTVACAKDDGAVDVCDACAPGFWGDACEMACDAGSCEGEVTCNKGGGELLTCERCAPGYIGELCRGYAPASCRAWYEGGAGVDGSYVIDPDGEMGAIPPSTVWCDMTTAPGGFTFLKVTADAAFSASEAEAYCAERGLSLFVPRTPAHLAAAWEIANDRAIGGGGDAAFLRIMGVYPAAQGATCDGEPLHSGNPDCDWVAGDGGAFWVGDREDLDEPSGDNDVDASLAYTFDADGHVVAYEESPSPGATSSRFICSAGDVDVTGRHCRDWLSAGFATSGPYPIDPDGIGVGAAAFDAYCDQTTLGGGWTLVLTSSDDGVATWSWNNRALMSTDTTLVGSVDAPQRDFKSAAYHALGFRDLLFVHRPSGVTAEYKDVGDDTQDVGSFVGGFAVPVCDYGLAGNGYPLTGGSLTQTGRLCDTDLYFNLGDHEISLSNCQSLTDGAANATFGPTWSWGNNDGCPFDDPSSTGLGPTPLCGGCPAGIEAGEEGGRGFGFILGLNTAAAGTAGNAMQMYVRDAVPCAATAECASGGLCIEGACRSYARSCLDWLDAGFDDDGVYAINPRGDGSFEVFCDMTTGAGGWTVMPSCGAIVDAGLLQIGAPELTGDDGVYMIGDAQAPGVRSYCDMEARVVLCAEVEGDHRGVTREGSDLPYAMRSVLRPDDGVCELWNVRHATNGYPLDNIALVAGQTLSSCETLGFVGNHQLNYCSFGAAYGSCGFPVAYYRYGNLCSGCQQFNGAYDSYRLQGPMNTASVMSNASGTIRTECKTR